MQAIYNKTTGAILVYVSDTADLNVVKSNWPDVSESVHVDSMPPRKEVGQWHINLETLTLEKINLEQ
jgi:hypothetical protein